MKIIFILALFLSVTTYASKEFRDGTEASSAALANEEAPAFPEHDALNTVFLENEGDKFSLHQPTYFLVGKDDAKLQFSFKYRILKKTPIHFGYTQKMFWDIYENSKPFNDLNYAPEFFYRFKFNRSLLKSVDISYMHVSNGKEGPESRSMDQVYVAGNLVKHTVDRVSFVFTVQAHYIFNKDGTNKDIDDYYGYTKFSATAMNILNAENNKFDLGVSAFPGRKRLRSGAYEINLRYAPNIKEFNPAILLQYYQGHGESLIKYNSNDEVLRLGFILFI